VISSGATSFSPFLLLFNPLLSPVTLIRSGKGSSDSPAFLFRMDVLLRSSRRIISAGGDDSREPARIKNEREYGWEIERKGTSAGESRWHHQEVSALPDCGQDVNPWTERSFGDLVGH